MDAAGGRVEGDVKDKTHALESSRVCCHSPPEQVTGSMQRGAIITTADMLHVRGTSALRGERGTSLKEAGTPCAADHFPLFSLRASSCGSPASHIFSQHLSMSYGTRWNSTILRSKSTIPKAACQFLSRGCPTAPGLMK